VVAVVRAPPGQEVGPGGGSRAVGSGKRFICRYFYDHMQQQLRALS